MEIVLWKRLKPFPLMIINNLIIDNIRPLHSKTGFYKIAKNIIGHGFYFLICMMFLVITSCSKNEEAPDPMAAQACFTLPVNALYEADVELLFDSNCSKNGEQFSWDFGDGETSSNPNPSHSYQSEGTYRVILTVRTSDGHIDVFEKALTIGPSALIKHSGFIDEPETWDEGKHLITGNIYIRHGSLTIAPGADICFDKEASIYVGTEETAHQGGALFSAVGTSAKPITFRPSSGLEQPGEWGNIFFTDTASDSSVLEHCKLLYGGSGNSFLDPNFEEAQDLGLISLDQCTISILNSEVTGAYNWGILVREGAFFDRFSGNSIDRSSNYPLAIDVNSVHTIGTGNIFDTSSQVYVMNQYFKVEDATWQALNVPYFFPISLIAGATTDISSLTILPGAVLSFSEQAKFQTGTTSTIRAIGTPDNPIVFTGAVQRAGSWKGLLISGNTTIEHSIIEYAGAESEAVFLLDATEQTVFSNNLIRFSGRDGVKHNGHEWELVFEDNRMEDCARFGMATFSTTVHRVPLSNTFANTMGFLVSGQGIRGQVTWPVRADIDYVVSGTLSILGYADDPDGPKSLTLPAGTNLQLRTNASIEIARSNNTFGSLIAKGTAANPIKFTLAEIDKENGNWGTIWFANVGANNSSELTNCIFDKGGNYHLFPSYGALSFSHTDTANAPIFHDNIIRNSGTYGVTLEYTTLDVSNNIFEDNALGDVHQLN